MTLNQPTFGIIALLWVVYCFEMLLRRAMWPVGLFFKDLKLIL